MLDPKLITVKVIEETDNFAQIDIEPLERGYAQTIGNALRRVLLSSLKGAAVTSVKINTVKHEYSTIPGVEEDVLNVVLNLKQLRLISHSDEKQTLYLNVKKAGEVRASDLEASADVEILNKDLIIATLADNKNPLNMEVTVETGIGYANIDNRREEIGLIPIDANFSPVERVNFSVGSARLGQVTDLDKLTFEIYTKSIKPSEALNQALGLFADMLTMVKSQLNGQEDVVEAVEEKPEEEAVEEKKPKAKKSTKKKAE